MLPAVFRRSPRLGGVIVVLLGCLAPPLAEAQPAEVAVLRGHVTDGPTGVPIADVVVRVGDSVVHTGADGSYELWMEAGAFVLEVYADLPNGQHEALRQAGLEAESGQVMEREIRLVTDAFMDAHPLLEDGIGVPMQRTAVPPEDTEPIDLLELWWERAHPDGPSLEDLRRLELPDVLPATIRVLRRYPDGCSGTDYPISEVDLDTYAAGVVTAEIGVFRALTTGEESQLEGFKTFAIAARSYGLYWWARDPDAAWHLDDTACKQRYTDGPYPAIIQQAVDETAGMYLVRGGTESTIDAFEYAASCGRCGSRPEYQDALVPDETGIVACTSGGWCGHNSCAGHEDNPACSLEGTGVRCLVRGICQWGTAERSAQGQAYTEILAHYQPNLDIAGGEAPTIARLLGFVREGSGETGMGIVGAQVSLDTGEMATTSATGLYTFSDIEPGPRQLSVRADGYVPVDQSVLVEANMDNWADIVLEPLDDAPDADLDPVEPVSDAGQIDEPETGVQDAAAPEVGPGNDERFEETGPGSSSNTFGRFAQVGPAGLEGGCGCHAADGAPAPLSAMLLLIAVLGRRRRS